MMHNEFFYRVKKVTKIGTIHALLMVTVAVCLFPLLWIVRGSFMTNRTIFREISIFPSEFHFENYVHAWIGGNFGTYFINSLIYTAVTVFFIVLLSSLAAYAFSRLEFPGKNILFLMFVAALMIPLPGSFVPLVVMMNKLGLANTQHGYILCMINVGLSMSIFLLKAFFDKMPRDLEDAARIDGCGRLKIWWHVALPLARPALAVVVIFNSLMVWNEYILATLLFNDQSMMPLQQGLMFFYGSESINYPVLMAGLTISILPVMLICLGMQKHIIQGLTSEAIVG